MLGILSAGETCCICCMSYLGHPWLCGHCLSWTWMSWSQLWLLLLQFHHWICVSWGLSLSSHTPWHVRGGLDMWCPLSSSLIWPIFWLQNVLLHDKGNSILCTIFSASVGYWHLSTRSLMHWSNWSVDLCSPCLMSLYISSMWFRYEIDTSSVSVIALKTSSGFF